MSYDNKDFWSQYQDYLEEVRPRHAYVIDTLLNGMLKKRLHLLDLGCGKCREAKSLINPGLYFGVDQVFEPDETTLGRKLDYRKDGEYIADWIPFPPNCFSSFFSAEITAPPEENYLLYENIFRTFPSIGWGIVSGFFYGNRKNQKTVTETGGLTSYQTIENPADFISKTFEEGRFVFPVPSKMFGPDVYEVWKLLVRR